LGNTCAVAAAAHKLQMSACLLEQLYVLFVWPQQSAQEQQVARLIVNVLPPFSVLHDREAAAA
jgi:hypothetical protein